MNSRLSFTLALCLGVLVFSHADADHHKKKNKDNGGELTQCTIQQPGGGGGCVTGFKQVCEKMKNGQKCCGCVADKSAQAPAQAPAPATAQPNTSGCGETCSLECKDADQKFLGVCFSLCFAKHSNLCGKQ